MFWPRVLVENNTLRENFFVRNLGQRSLYLRLSLLIACSLFPWQNCSLKVSIVPRLIFDKGAAKPQARGATILLEKRGREKKHTFRDLRRRFPRAFKYFIFSTGKQHRRLKTTKKPETRLSISFEASERI